jgi:hypothetical protein
LPANGRMTRALLVASSLSGSNLMADAGLEGTETEAANAVQKPSDRRKPVGCSQIQQPEALAIRFVRFGPRRPHRRPRVRSPGRPEPHGAASALSHTARRIQTAGIECGIAAHVRLGGMVGPTKSRRERTVSRSPSTRSAKLARERWERRAEQGRCRATARRMPRPQNRAGSSAAGELAIS